MMYPEEGREGRRRVRCKRVVPHVCLNLAGAWLREAALSDIAVTLLESMVPQVPTTIKTSLRNDHIVLS